MKHERGIKKAGYAVVVALLALVFCCYWVARQIERGEPPAFLSDGVASVVAYICGLIFYVAVALTLFIVVRAFYIGLTKSDSKRKHERDG